LTSRAASYRARWSRGTRPRSRRAAAAAVTRLPRSSSHAACVSSDVTRVRICRSCVVWPGLGAADWECVTSAASVGAAVCGSSQQLRKAHRRRTDVQHVSQVNQKEEVRLRAPPPEPAPEPAGPSAEECAPRSACQKRARLLAERARRDDRARVCAADGLQWMAHAAVLPRHAMIPWLTWSAVAVRNTPAPEIRA